MTMRTPVQRLTLLTVATAVMFLGLIIALTSLDRNSGAHGVVAVSGMVVALALVGFAWSLASAVLAARRSPK